MYYLKNRRAQKTKIEDLSSTFAKVMFIALALIVAFAIILIFVIMPLAWITSDRPGLL